MSKIRIQDYHSGDNSIVADFDTASNLVDLRVQSGAQTTEFTFNPATVGLRGHTSGRSATHNVTIQGGSLVGPTQVNNLPVSIFRSIVSVAGKLSKRPAETAEAAAEACPISIDIPEQKTGHGNIAANFHPDSGLLRLTVEHQGRITSLMFNPNAVKITGSSLEGTQYISTEFSIDGQIDTPTHVPGLYPPTFGKILVAGKALQQAWSIPPEPRAAGAGAKAAATITAG